MLRCRLPHQGSQLLSPCGEIAKAHGLVGAAAGRIELCLEVLTEVSLLSCRAEGCFQRITSEGQ